MTISITARSNDGGFGIAIASSSPAVASRCIHLRPRVGASASQNVTNPALGAAVLDALALGQASDAAIRTALSDDDFAEYRQLTAVGADGPAAVHSGALALGLFGASSEDGCVAAGNMLANDDVLPAMVAAFESTGGTLENRLLSGLRGGLAAGGEAGPLRSAGIGVVASVSWRVTDLRVDDHDAPVDELERLLELWMPQKGDYLTRALSPGSAPSYGVPGDE